MHLRPLEHVSHFTPKTLRRLLLRAGFEKVAISTPNYVDPPIDLDGVLAVFHLPALKSFAQRLCRKVREDDVERVVPGALLWPPLKLLDRALVLTRVGNVVFSTARVQ